MSITKTPWLRTVSLPPPSLQNNTADADRLVATLKAVLQTDDAIYIDLKVLKKLPDLLRKYDFNIQCILFKNRWQWSLLDIRCADDSRPVGGLAVDLGTSRVMLRLLDLSDGQILAESGFDNPQLTIGPDILTRIHYTESAGGLAELNELIIGSLNHAIEAVCRSSRIETTDIYALAVAGNTAMTHLFLGINPRWIIREPYIPVVNKPEILKAAELGLQVNPAAEMLIFPNIGSYFGGDLIAGILYTGLCTASDTALLVDVGTNAEVVLGNQSWLIACAGAAAPTAMLLYSLIVVWFATEGHRFYRPIWRPWYCSKARASFADMLATLRQESIREQVSAMPITGRGSRKLVKSFIHAVQQAA